jgi:hypothetical protein
MLTAVLLVLLGLILVGWIVLTFVVKQKRSQGAEQVRARLGEAGEVRALDDKAICKGTESGPFNHLVGMGTLGYNGEELLFVRWSPPAELSIPKADLVAHEFSVDYQGKPSKKPLLVVTYTNPEHTEGETPGQDQVAWEVVDPDAWNEALKG